MTRQSRPSPAEPTHYGYVHVTTEDKTMGGQQKGGQQPRGLKLAIQTDEEHNELNFYSW